jgi:hypothetical protein
MLSTENCAERICESEEPASETGGPERSAFVSIRLLFADEGVDRSILLALQHYSPSLCSKVSKFQAVSGVALALLNQHCV